ncbi:MAG: DUF2306 domain-containing protein [Bacteroidota bacterium]
MKKKAFITFLVVGAIAMIVMSSHYLYSNTSGILKRKEVASSLWYLLTFRAHVLFGLFAITAGPIQFIKRIRTRNTRLHRVLGYFYFVGVILSSLSGSIVAQFAMGGRITSIGFSILAILWFYATVKSITAIRNGNISDHEKWSYFSYALTFAAITQRSLLLIPLLTGVPFMPIYQLSAWLPWLLNLSIAYLILRFSSERYQKIATNRFS